MDETASGVCSCSHSRHLPWWPMYFHRLDMSQFIEELSKLSVLMPRHSTEDWLRTTYIILICIGLSWMNISQAGDSNRPGYFWPSPLTADWNGLKFSIVFPSDPPWTLDMGDTGHSYSWKERIPGPRWVWNCSTMFHMLSSSHRSFELAVCWVLFYFYFSISFNFSFLSLSLSLSGSLFAYFIPWKDSFSLLAWEAPIFGGNVANFLWIDFPPNQTIDPLNIMFFCWFPDFDGEWSSLLVNFPGLIYHHALR